MAVYDIRLFIEGDLRPWERSLVEVVEQKRPDLKVIATARTLSCPMCGGRAEITTHWGRERKRWWQFWKFSRVPNDYYFSSEHECYKETAKRFTEPGSVWYRQATGTVESLQVTEEY